MLALLVIVIPVGAGLLSGFTSSESPKMELEFIPPERMNSGFQVGDIFESRSMENWVIQAAEPFWIEKMSGSRSKPVSASRPFSFTIVRNEASSGSSSIGLSKFKVMVDSRSKHALTLTLSNAYSHTLSTSSFQEDFQPRYEYWKKPFKRLNGNVAILELITADAVEIRIQKGQKAEADLETKLNQLQAELDNVKGAVVRREGSVISLYGKQLAVACKLWKIPSPKSGTPSWPAKVEFVERIPGGVQTFNLIPSPRDGAIPTPNEYEAGATLIIRSNKLFVQAYASILGQGFSGGGGQIRFSTGGDVKREDRLLSKLDYHSGTELSLSGIHVDTLPKQSSGSPGDFVEFPVPGSQLVDMYLFRRSPTKKCEITLKPLEFTVRHQFSKPD